MPALVNLASHDRRLDSMAKVRNLIVALALAFLTLGLTPYVRGQVDCIRGLKIYARDETGKPLEGGKLEVEGTGGKLPGTVRFFVEPGGVYNINEAQAATLKGSLLFRVSAEGFEPYERQFSFPGCEIQRFELRLRRQGSAAAAVFERLFTVHGKVFDEEMKPFGNARVEARAAGGRTYQAYSNAYGYFEINLPKGVMNITVKAGTIPEIVFEKFRIEKNYSVLNVPVCRKCEQQENKN